MTDVSNDVVFITGATAGMGAAFARRFIAEGARVIATGRRADRLKPLQKELGDRLSTSVLDVCDRSADWSRFFSTRYNRRLRPYPRKSPQISRRGLYERSELQS